ncbi:MAG: PAS domain-containing protein [Terrimicrobiaceae bacterium]
MPPGSVVQFREPTYWEKHRRLILAAAALVALQTALITILLVQLRRRRLAEEAMRESEERVNLATASAGAGLWAVDLATRRMWVTDRTRQLFGFGADEEIDWDRRLRAIHPEDRERARSAAEEALRTGRPYVVELRVVQPDGTTRWVASCAAPHPGSNGKPARLMGASIDITERKHAEEELHRQHVELAHVTRTNMLGELSGSLAHELGQPLGAVLANAEAAELHLAKAAPNLEEVRAILADIRGESIRAGGIVHGMRSFLRRHDVEFEPVDLPALIEELKKLVGPDAILHHTTLDFQLPAGLPRIRGQHVQLQQVLLNLILNSIQAMKDSPTTGRHVAVTAVAREEGLLEFAVTDAGTDVPPDKREQRLQESGRWRGSSGCSR